MSKAGEIPVRKRFPYRRPPELDAASPRRLKLLIVGGGPIGLTAALDLAQRGYEIVLLNKLDIVADGSKALCFSKRTLEVYDRLGVGERLVREGVAWNLGKVFWGDRAEPIYEFTMLPIPDQKNPGFINLQQFYLEEYLLDALAAFPNVDIRWRNEVIGVEQRRDHVEVRVDTPDGAYTLAAEYVLACDGSKSPIRGMLGLDFEGKVFEDNFLIADVRFEQERPTERWFWFSPPFPGESALLHKQPHGVWRLDFQLGWNIDRDEAVKPENVAPFVEGMIGKDVPYSFEWLSIYTFQCRRMARFLHDRILFAGDAAHLVSPFGARGANGGVADVENLVWKLDLVLKGAAPRALLESYDDEATTIADVNILNSTRSTEFITPKSRTSRALRDAVLGLAQTHAFARPFVNSGRLATAVATPRSPLNTPDDESWRGGVAPGTPAIDARLGDQEWLLAHLHNGVTLLALNLPGPAIARARALARDLADISAVRFVSLRDTGASSLAERYDAAGGALYLVRPDQYVAARWKTVDEAKVRLALKRLLGHMLVAEGARYEAVA
ncbi:MAG: FAD-dependent oxidoreductase [Hyphomonadaceae bacterium]|nr:FAD-dependent oxidoreductase [Hyphomonadaceae bacterium]